MNRLLVCAGMVAVFTVSSCETKEPVSSTESVVEESLNLDGKWVESVGDSATVFWSFDGNVLEWNGYTHHVDIQKDTMQVSHLTFQILLKNEDSLILCKNSGGDTTLLIKHTPAKTSIH